MVGIVLVVVDGGAVAEFGSNPVVNTAHVVDEFVLSERAAPSDSVGPDEVTTDACIITVVEACHDHVVHAFANELIVFGKNLPSCADVEVGANLACVVEHEFATQAAPMFLPVFVGKTVVVDGEVGTVVVAVDEGAAQTQNFAEWIAELVEGFVGYGAVIIIGVVVGDVAV